MAQDWQSWRSDYINRILAMLAKINPRLTEVMRQK